MSALFVAFLFLVGVVTAELVRDIQRYCEHHNYEAHRED